MATCAAHRFWIAGHTTLNSTTIWESKTMPHSTFVLTLAMILLILPDCSNHPQNSNSATNTQEAARKKLEQQKIPYTKEEFLERVKKGDTRSVELFLTAGMGANTRYKANTTPLMEACLFERVDIVKVLLGGGADVNAKDDFGRTALIFAIQNGGQTSIVKALLDRGADANATLADGRTPLMLSIDSPDIVKALVEKGADINAKNRDTGESVLMTMVLADNPESVKSLLARDANVNAKDDRGVTALMFAASNNKIVIAKLLLQKGADVNIKADNGETALLMAKRNGFSTMMQLLRQAGAKD
jgi:ankyrin repeat protein